MRIVIVGPYPLSPDCIHGGVESSVFGLAQVLVSQQHEVDVLDYPRIAGSDTCERKQLLSVHRYSNTGRHNQDAQLRVDDMLRDIVALHPDIVHLHGTNQLCLCIYRALTAYHIPTLLTVHGLLHEEKKKALCAHPSPKRLYQYIRQSRAERQLLNLASTIVVDTQYVADEISQLLEHHRIAQLPQTHIIPQGISSNYFQITCEQTRSTLLSVGAIAPRKGHILTVRMFNTLRAKGVKATLRIVGSLADTSYYKQLSDFILRSPYRSDIFLHTNLNAEDLLAAYRSAHLFVLHSQEESQGIVFSEAMAAGLPVVATRVGGIPCVVEHEQTGLLCEYGDTDTMALMVERLLADQQLWQSFSNHARRSSLSYDWPHIAKTICTLYAELAALPQKQS